MFSFQSKVRYSELDASGKLGLEGIINYMQDCSTFQSEDLGVGIAYLRSAKRVWVINNWEIMIHEELHVGDEITISTWAHDFKGFLGWRNFVIEKDGRRCVEADSLWSYLDTENGHPVKASTDVIERYGTEEALQLPPIKRKLALPPEYETKDPFLVRNYHLDTNGHVNNGKYIALAAEYLPKNAVVRKLRVEYKKSALYGDWIYPRMSRSGETVTVSLCDQSGSVYAAVEFQTEAGGER